MSMALDGFIAGPKGDTDVDRLHEWALGGERRPAGVNGQVFDEFMATGAVVAGRGTFEPAGGWNGDHHDGVPIFILSRHEPGPEFARFPAVTYVSDLESAVR